MNNRWQLVTFRLANINCALPLSAVARVIHAVEVTPLPEAPAIVLGVINLHGEVVPVVNIRRRLGLPSEPIRLSDCILVARTARRTLGLLVDATEDVVEVAEAEVTAAERLVPGLEHAAGVARLNGGLILIYDLERFLSLEEEAALAAALAAP